MLRLRAAVLATSMVLVIGVELQGGFNPDDAHAGPGGKPTPACGGEAPAKPDGGAWTCAFSEDFDGAKLDPAKWMVNKTSYAGVSSDNLDCFVDDPKNIAVSGGALHLTSRRESAPFQCQSPAGDFTASTTAATVMTRDRFAQAYGRFEFRARFPRTTTQGVQSALWLYPQTDTYGAWPNSGEIDVAEWYSSVPEQVYPSVHHAGEVRPYSTGHTCAVPSANSAYHRYAVEWTPTLMRFLYDGIPCWEYSWTPAAPLAAPQPFDQPFFLLLTQVFGGGADAVVPETPSTATMDVDWVRVWK